MKIISLSMILFLVSSMVVAQENKSSQEAVGPSTVSKPLLTQKDKEKIAKDAKELTENFGVIIDDLSSLGQKIAKSFVDTLSIWISENYKKLSEGQRKRLKKFITRMKEQLRDLEQMSVNNLSKVLKDMKNFLKQLEKGVNSAESKKKSESTKLI